MIADTMDAIRQAAQESGKGASGDGEDKGRKGEEGKIDEHGREQVVELAMMIQMGWTRLHVYLYEASLSRGA